MESSSLTVYTAITSQKDTLLGNQAPGGGKYIAFCDMPQENKGWEIRKAYDRFMDKRRNSRIQKILSHHYIDSEYSLYIDGNIRVLTDPRILAEKYLKDHDIAVYQHPTRDCIYDEAMVCAKRGLDDPEVIIAQAKYYEDSGFGKHKGLNECGIIFRRNTAKVQEFNNAWWGEYCVHSRRDQISFPVAAEAAGIRVNSIFDPFIESPGGDRATRVSGDFEIVLHQHQK